MYSELLQLGLVGNTANAVEHAIEAKRQLVPGLRAGQKSARGSNKGPEYAVSPAAWRRCYRLARHTLQIERVVAGQCAGAGFGVEKSTLGT